MKLMFKVYSRIASYDILIKEEKFSFKGGLNLP